MTLLVFLPSLLYEEKCGYLQGVVYNFSDENVNLKTVVVYGKLTETAENGNVKYSVWEKSDTLGYYYSSFSMNFYFVPRKTNWISVGINSGEFFIKEAFSNYSLVPLKECRLFVYDKSQFLKSELLFKPLVIGDGAHSDCFVALMSALDLFSSLSDHDTKVFTLLKPLFIIILKTFNFILYYSTCCESLLKFSSVGLHCHNFLKNISWVFTSIVSEKKLTLKTGNFFCALLVDIVGGTLVLFYLINAVSSEDVVSFICDSSEVRMFHTN